MTNGELIVAIIMFIFAGICAFISFRQSAIVFCFLTAVFIIIGLAIVFQNDKIQLIEIPVIAGAIIYAIASSIRIEKNNKR